MKEVPHVIDVDLGKSVFQIHAVDGTDRVIARRRLRRSEVLSFLAGVPQRLSRWKSARAKTSDIYKLIAACSRA